MAGQTKFGPVVGRRAFGAGWTRRWSGPGFRAQFYFRAQFSMGIESLPRPLCCSLPPPTLLRLGGQGGAAGVDERYGPDLLQEGAIVSALIRSRAPKAPKVAIWLTFSWVEPHSAQRIALG
jgi:hypothetical protein